MDDCVGETSNYLFNQDNFFSHFAYCFGMIHLFLDYLFIETWQIYNCAFMCEIYKKKKKKPIHKQKHVRITSKLMPLRCCKAHLKIYINRYK